MSKDIYTKNGNDTYRLAFNESFRLFSSNDSVAFEIIWETQQKWTFAFHFTHIDNKGLYGIDSSVDEKANTITINLNKWYSTNLIEFTSPLHFESKDKSIELKILVTSLCSAINKGRTFSVSVWRKTKL